MWGSDIKKLDVGIPQGGNFWIEENTAFLGGDDFYGFYIDSLDIYAALFAAILVISLVIFSAQWQTTTKPPSPSASLCAPSGSSSGPSQGSSPSSLASCGVPNPACNSPYR